MFVKNYDWLSYACPESGKKEQSNSPLRSHSESSKRRSTTIFAILLLILLVLSLLIALFVYQKNRRKYEIQNSSPNPNQTPKVETSDTNRENRTLEGQSSTNGNTSVSKQIDTKSDSKTEELEDRSVRSERI